MTFLSLSLSFSNFCKYNTSGFYWWKCILFILQNHWLFLFLKPHTQTKRKQYEKDMKVPVFNPLCSTVWTGLKATLMFIPIVHLLKEIWLLERNLHTTKMEAVFQSLAFPNYLPSTHSIGQCSLCCIKQFLPSRMNTVQ